MKTKRYGRYTFKPTEFESVFLPAPASVARLLGLPDNAARLIPMLEEHYERPLNIGRSTRAELTRSGAAKPTMNKLIDWLHLVQIPIRKLICLPVMLKAARASKIGSNAGDWFSASYGVYLQGTDSELITVFDFINDRADADYVMVKNIKQQINTGKIDRHDAHAIWQAQILTWEKYSRVPSEHLACYSLYTASHSEGGGQSEQEELAVLKAVLHLTLDFYLSVLAHFELGLSLYYVRRGIKDASEPHHSVFSSVIRVYAIEDEKCTCFGAMLSELRNTLGRYELKHSWRALASYIDVDESGELAETLKDKQYRQLKDWRNGKNMPSDKKLRAFVASLLSEMGAGKYEVDTVMILLRICRGIDQLVAQLCGKVGDERVASIIAEVLSEYPNYFEHYKRVLTKDAQR